MSEQVNHPEHYNQHPSGIECIEVVRHMPFNIGSAIKYLWRADHKGRRIEDLRKAIWYIEDEIQRLSVDSLVKHAEQVAQQFRETADAIQGIGDKALEADQAIRDGAITEDEYRVGMTE